MTRAGIVSAEKLKEGLLIEFEDGLCAIFSDSLLFDTLPQAIEVKNTEPVAWVCVSLFPT